VLVTSSIFVILGPKEMIRPAVPIVTGSRSLGPTIKESVLDTVEELVVLVRFVAYYFVVESPDQRKV
jgi:hypothetical protein